MSVQYQGRTIPSDDAVADLPRNFRDFIDSGPLPRFADATERDAAITAPVTGMMVYMIDSGDLLRYNGSAWVPWIPLPVEDVNFVSGSTLAAITATTFSNFAGGSEFPKVTLVTGSQVIVIVSCFAAAPDAAGEGGSISYEVTGATSIGPLNETAAYFEAENNSDRNALSVIRQEIVTPGVNTFQMVGKRHNVNPLSSVYIERPRIQVIPLVL